MEYGKLGTVKSRDMKSCLSHESEESDCLERYGLTSGVRSGYNEKIEVFAEVYINRDDLLCVNERMAAFFDVDIAVFIHYRLTAVVAL